MTSQITKRHNTGVARDLACGIALAITMSTLPFSAAAQTPPAAPAKMEMGKGSATDAPMKMHKSMDDMQTKSAAMKMTGDTDIDFAMMMVVHHQGAIDMAQVEVDTGKDPAMIKIAKKIIAAQKKEITQFESWLKKHPHAMK